MATEENLIVCRRSGKDKSINRYIPCPKCKAFYSKTSLYKHYKKCDKSKQRNAKGICNKAAFLKKSNKNKILCERTNNMLSVLNDDLVTGIILGDDFLLDVAADYINTYRQQHHETMIRQNLRQLANFFIKIKEIDDTITNFKCIFHPKYYEATVKAVDILGQPFNDNSEYKIPSKPSCLLRLLKKCSELRKTQSIVHGDEASEQANARYFHLLTIGFKKGINKTVHETVIHRIRDKVVNLPLEEDILKFTNYISEHIGLYYNCLLKEFNFDNWEKLSAYCLISIIIFNARRPGEMERLYITDFERRERMDPTMVCDFKELVTESDIVSASDYAKVNMRGKLGRNVSAYFHSKIVECLDLILHYREDAKICDTNPFLFALPKQSIVEHRYNYLRACHWMRKFTQNAQLKKPELIRATLMRKRAATILDGMGHEQDVTKWFSNFMGHAMKIHNEHYVQSNATKELLCIPKLLTQIQAPSSKKNAVVTQNLIIRNKTIADTYESDAKVGNISTEQLCDVTRNKIPKLRKSWSVEEKELAASKFIENISLNIPPSLEKCTKIIENNPVLQSRTPLQLQAWVLNQINIKSTQDRYPLEQKNKKRGKYYLILICLYFEVPRVYEFIYYF